MSAPEATVWREGDRIRATEGMGFADIVPDEKLREYAADPKSAEYDRRFAAAVLAIREFERCDPLTGLPTPDRGSEASECPTCGGSGVQPDYSPNPDFRPCETCSEAQA